MTTMVTKWAEPKPGHEDAYLQAMIDRHRASMDMLSIGILGRLFQYRRYQQMVRRWEDAVDRMKEHGQDIVRHSR